MATVQQLSSVRLTALTNDMRHRHMVHSPQA